MWECWEVVEGATGDFTRWDVLTWVGSGSMFYWRGNGWRRRGKEDNDEEKEEVHRDAHRPSLPILKTTHAIFVSCVEDLLSTSALACANNVRTVELEETLQLAPYLCSVHQHVVFQGWVDLWTFTYNYTCELSIPALNGPSIYNCVLVNLTPQLEALCQASDRGTLCLLKYWFRAVGQQVSASSAFYLPIWSIGSQPVTCYSYPNPPVSFISVSKSHFFLVSIYFCCHVRSSQITI